MTNKNILNFFFELGLLSKNKHAGWVLAGVPNSELMSMGDHTARTAQIAFVLAKMEGYENPHEVCTMAVFHDMIRTRSSGAHKVAARYMKGDKEKAAREETESLGEIGEDICRMWKETNNRLTQAGNIAKDADQLEQAITSKEYVEKGYKLAQDWIEAIAKFVITDSAKQLMTEINQVNSTDWWQGLKVRRYDNPELNEKMGIKTD